MNDLIVAENENKMLLKSIEHGEGDITLVVSSMDGLFADVAQAVIHPAHIPLEPKAEPVVVGRMRYTGIGCGFLRNHGHAGEALVGDFVAALEEADRFEVLASTEAIRDPLAFLAGIIEIEHRGDSVYPQSIDMILVKPEDGVAN